MEQFPALPMRQWDYITKMINDSDYYLLIIAGKYGSIDEESGLSYTEKEFHYALDLGIPIISFLYKDLDKLSADKKEGNDSRKERVERFREEVKDSGHLCGFYNSCDELKYVVSKSIRRTIEMCPAIGWVKCDEIDDYQSGVIERLMDLYIVNQNIQEDEKRTNTDTGREERKPHCGLSKEAKTLLKKACENEDGRILVAHSTVGTSVSVGKHVFCDEATAKLEAIWIGAINELERKGLILDRSGKDEVYSVTIDGYNYYDTVNSEVSVVLKENGFDEMDIAIVNHIYDNPNCSMADIANRVLLSQVSVSRRVKRLKERGVVQKVGNARNGKWDVNEFFLNTSNNPFFSLEENTIS